MNGAYWSSKLDEVFKSNYLADPSITWQYFCSSDGFFRVFPGMYTVMRRSFILHIALTHCILMEFFTLIYLKSPFAT